jgi:DNA-binding NarL/FixJ family response regulator
MHQLILYSLDEQLISHWERSLATIQHGLSLPVVKATELSQLESAPLSNETLVLFHLKEDDAHIQTLENLLSRGIPVLVMVNVPKDDLALHWLQQGAKGVMNAYANGERLVQAVNSIAEGYVWVGQQLMQKMIQSLSNVPEGMQQTQTENEGLSDDMKALLTEREIETVEEVLQGKSNAEIAQDMNITERTVKAHLNSIFKKLGVSDRLALVLKVLKKEGKVA